MTLGIQSCKGYLPDTFDEAESPVVVRFIFTPEEPRTYDHPGSAAEIELVDVMLTDPMGTHDVLWQLNDKQEAYIQQQVEEYLTKHAQDESEQ